MRRFVLVSSFVFSTVLLTVATQSASANLEAREGGTLVYDTDLNITWFSDGQASGQGGQRNILDWAAGLDFAGQQDWRIASMSEMNHLFYNELSGHVGSPISNSLDPDVALFSGFPGNRFVTESAWSPEVYIPDQAHAWAFNFEGNNYAGKDEVDIKTLSTNWGWAVHDGDIGVVPEPSTALLMGLGLVALSARRRPTPLTACR